MSDRPTPETDQFKVKFKTVCGEKYWIPVDIARKLERERDDVRDAFVIATDQMVIAQGKLREANKERDEARKELYDIRLNLGEDAKGYTLADAVILLQNARNDHRAVDVEWREHNER
jgi:predicted house-cleaning NTP pyrophosphatase (Maf/HAM1 superfamily)